VNPRIPADRAEVGRWLLAFARSHAKREDPRLEAVLETGTGAQGAWCAVRLRLPGLEPAGPTATVGPLAHGDVAEGRTRFSWCEDLARRVRTAARGLAAQAASAVG
jgi:hypothetical protein